MNRIIATLFALFIVSTASAHPGHPTFDSSHTRGAFEIDPFYGFAWFALVVAGLLIGRATYRQRVKR